MKNWEVDIASLAEFCVAWEDKIPRQVIAQITKQYDSNACWTVASSKVPVGSFCKPGGTGILVMGKNTGRIVDRGSDPWNMGRWSFTLIQGTKETDTLLFIVGYRPGKRSSPGGLKTAWAQQQALLMKSARNESPHDAFLTDLSAWLYAYKTDNMEVLLCLDANEQWSDSSQIRRFATEFRLIHINKELGLPATHPNIANLSKSTSIDFCLGSAKVFENISFSASAPYDLEVLGDHRGVILDINIAALLGSDTTVEEIKTRNLVTSNPKAMNKYLDLVTDKFQKQNIYDRCQKLLRRVRLGHTDMLSIMKHYERIDKEVHGICTKAEKKCKPKWSGKYEWSPKLAGAIKLISYWRLRLKHQEETVVLKKLGKELNIPFVPMSNEMIHQQIQNGKNLLKDAQHNDRQYRQDHLMELADQYAAQNKVSTQTAIIELIAQEDVKTTFKQLRHHMKPASSGQLAKLWIAEDDAGNYVKDVSRRTVYTTGKEIHSVLLQRNARHLRQASRTPFARGNLRNRLKWDGTGKLASELLTGEVLNQQQFSPAMQLYLESIKVQDLSRLNLVRPNLSIEDYYRFWKKKKETTVTSPYGLHVGHYKSATYNLKVLEVHRVLLLIPFLTGMAPIRWRRTVQTMLEKESGSPWIHRLRIIELFDAQANAGFQIFIGRHMMHHAVQNNLLSEESFGSTPGKMAASALIQKMIAVDQLRLERRAGGIFDCDATGCYDRILPPLASVHMQSLGIHESIGTLLARLMFMSKRHVRTKHGVSKKNIATTRKHVLHGIGQGNGGGPAMWISHLSVMFVALSSVCLGFVMKCVENIKEITTVGTGYVDDVTLGVSVPNTQQQSEKNVHSHIRKMGQLWEKLLYITGGKLELSKCFWVPITWRWSGGKPVMNTKPSRSGELYLTESESKQRCLIPKRKGTDVEKRLGVASACDGKWRTEYEQWIQFSTSFSRRLRYARLGRRVGFIAYHSLWVAKFRYSAPVIGYSKAQLSKIQQTVIGLCLSVAGYCSKIPRAVVYGPKSMGGLDWTNIGILTLYEKIKFLIGSIRLQDKVGQVLEVQLSWIQTFAGISKPVLEYDTLITYLPVGWIQNLHTKLVDYGVQIEVHQLWTPTHQRENDRVIMDIVIKHLPGWLWHSINRCRLFLKATTVADITTMDGTFIPNKIRLLKRELRETTLNFPIQRKPSRKDIVGWQYFIDFISCNGHLHVPLGRWTRKPDQVFPYVLNASTHIVYKRTLNGWSGFGKKSPTSRRYFPCHISTSTIPEECRPVQVIDGNRYLVIVTSTIDDRSYPLMSEAQTGDKYTIIKDQVMGTSHTDETKMESLQEMWHSHDGTILGATDGGLKDTVGSSSYAIFLPGDSTPVICGYATEYQPRAEASSTRQELLGQLGLEYWIDRLHQRWGRPRGNLQLVLITDSKASIDIMKSVPQALGISAMIKAEMDVALEIYSMQLKGFWIQRQTHKVTSHIEQEDAPDEFFWECNALADALATKARDECVVQELASRKSYIFPGAKLGCSIDGRLENNGLYNKLQDKISGEALRQYYLQKYDWTPTTFAKIAWDVYGREYHKYNRTNQVTRTKFIHGWLANNRKSFREGRSLTPCCPLCGREDHREHIFQCRDNQMQQIRSGLWKKLSTDISSTTESGCKEIFLAGMGTIIGYDPPTSQDKQGWPVSLLEAYESQTEIGWIQVFYGRLCNQWEVLARSPGQEVGRGQPYVWTGKVVRWCWGFGIALWHARNKIIHGDNPTISNQDRNKVRLLIGAMYRELRPQVRHRVREVFAVSEEEMSNQPIHTQVTWLERLKFLFSEKYAEISTDTVGKMKSDLETEMLRLRATGLGLDQCT